MEPSKPSKGARKTRRKDKKRFGHTDYRKMGMVIETLVKMTSPTISFLDLTGKIMKRSREAYEEEQAKKEKAAREKLGRNRA
tara:strand:- start:233 stop:478 length:246 start_codon:yes stop_codon:yes gene_type:complete